jgi:hypothetical protein
VAKNKAFLGWTVATPRQDLIVIEPLSYLPALSNVQYPAMSSINDDSYLIHLNPESGDDDGTTENQYRLPAGLELEGDPEENAKIWISFVNARRKGES